MIAYNGNYKFDENQTIRNKIVSMFKTKHDIFYTLINIIGSFRFSDSISTAAVGFSADGRCVDFLFNKGFFNSLNDYELEFVVAHECLHVYFEHGLRGIDVKNDNANIAMDVVINEALVNHYGYERSRIKKLDIHFINNTFTDSENILPNMMFEYYLNKLETNKKSGYKVFDSHFLLPNQFVGSKAIKEAESKVNIFEREKVHMIAGNMSRLDEINIEIKKTRNNKMASLITKKTMKVISDTVANQWVMPNRRLSEVDFLLPQEYTTVDKAKNLPTLAFFADCSGSCLRYAKEFYNTLFSLPPAKVACRHFVFDTSCKEIKRGDKMFAGGGTDFSCIIETINANYKKHPDMVFVLTDGEAGNIQPDYPERWNIFITDGGRKNSFINVNNIYPFSSFKAGKYDIDSMF